jgi:lactoylglutathione lyase
LVSYRRGVELVFKALADPTRRALLDALFDRDGQTLGVLAGRFDVTRVAVAKHLRLLETAGLVVSRRHGRNKMHYLNPVPIRLIHDRWVSKYTEAWAVGLAGLKRDLETAPVGIGAEQPIPPTTAKERYDVTVTRTHFTGVRTVSIPVDNQEEALRFYVETLKFTKLRDVATPNGGRWIELAPGDDNIIITLEPASSAVTRGAIGIRFTTDDAEAAHAALATAGVEVDDILRWPGTPAMFAFRDPDGNAFSITETS